LGITDALAEIEAGNEGGDATGDVDDRSSSEVERRDVATGCVEQATDSQTMWAMGQ